MILDSSFLIDVQTGHARAIQKALDLDAAATPQRIPLVVIFELYVGVGKGTQDDETEAAIDALLAAREIVPATEPIAKHAGRIEGEIQRDGTAVGLADAVIAATALEYDEPVVTDDRDYWAQIPREIAIKSY